MRVVNPSPTACLCNYKFEYPEKKLWSQCLPASKQAFRGKPWECDSGLLWLLLLVIFLGHRRERNEGSPVSLPFPICLLPGSWIKGGKSCEARLQCCLWVLPPAFWLKESFALLESLLGSQRQAFHLFHWFKMRKLSTGRLGTRPSHEPVTWQSRVYIPDVLIACSRL